MYVNESQRVPLFIFCTLRHFRKKKYEVLSIIFLFPVEEKVISQSYRAWKAHFWCLETVFKAFHEYELGIFKTLCAFWALGIASTLDAPVLFYTKRYSLQAASDNGAETLIEAVNNLSKVVSNLDNSVKRLETEIGGVISRLDNSVRTLDKSLGTLTNRSVPESSKFSAAIKSLVGTFPNIDLRRDEEVYMIMSRRFGCIQFFILMDQYCRIFVFSNCARLCCLTHFIVYRLFRYRNLEYPVPY